jgi:hypothetical protein
MHTFHAPMRPFCVQNLRRRKVSTKNQIVNGTLRQARGGVDVFSRQFGDSSKPRSLFFGVKPRNIARHNAFSGFNASVTLIFGFRKIQIIGLIFEKQSNVSVYSNSS